MIKLVSKYTEEYEKFCEGDALGARIISLLDAYCTQHNFVLFWEQRDDNLNLTAMILSIDNSVTVFEKDANAEEIKEFLTCIGFDSISTTPELANQICTNCNMNIRTIMKYNNSKISKSLKDKNVDDFCKSIDLKQIYDIINFCHNTPATKHGFEVWFTDMSHRIRHGYADAVATQSGDKTVSCALALASTKTDVLLGGVATLDDYRNRGLAKQCIYELIKRNKDKNIFIFCKEDKIDFYTKLGFDKYSLTAEVVH
ncbi:MAG: N-acetyltransferase [Clostridia bacterium]|nr:N-acetyltransferase [Clostridia bacterium]